MKEKRRDKVPGKDEADRAGVEESEKAGLLDMGAMRSWSRPGAAGPWR